MIDEIKSDIDFDAFTEMKQRVFPGLRYEDQFPDGIRNDGRGEPDLIEMQWRPNVKVLQNCDTPHLLYLLQIACDLHRQWVIERNQHFASISRPDRFIDHVDGPQLITNLLKWHTEDKQRNVFDGNQLLKTDGMCIINDFLGDIGTSVSSLCTISIIIRRPLRFKDPMLRRSLKNGCENLESRSS